MCPELPATMMMIMMVMMVMAATACQGALLSPMAQATLTEAHRVHVMRAQKYGFRAMSLGEMRSALSERNGPAPPPETLLHPWNPGARCIPKSDLVGEVDPVCLDVTEYDMVYADDLTPIRNQIVNGAVAALFVAGGAECSIASAWGVCPAMVSPCLPDVPVPGSGGEVVTLNVPTCFHLCDLILQSCIWEMVNIFGYDNETAHATLRCAAPQGNILFYGNTTYDIFPAAANHSAENNTITQLVTVTLGGASGNETVHQFEHTHECYDGTIGRTVNLAVLNCPDGLVRDDSTGFCHFECPEPLVTSSEYDALKALVTLGACVSVLSLTLAIVTYCAVPVLRMHPNSLALPLFLSLMGIALSLLLGAVDGYHEGTWCSDSGKPNEWGAGTCTVQGIGIVYFSYSSALWWFCIILHLAVTRGVPTCRRPAQSSDMSVTSSVNVPMRTQKSHLSFRIPFEWLFCWARRRSYRVPDVSESAAASSDSETEEDGSRTNNNIFEWPQLPKWLQRKLGARALGIRIYFYTLITHTFAWGIPVIPVIIGLSAKRIGYGGADLWCTVHSGADISFRVTTGAGVEHDQEHETNPWLLGLYIAPIFAILVVGSLLTLLVILSGCSVMGLVIVRYRGEGVLRNAWAFLSESSRQIRLVVFSGVFVVVFISQLLWLAYFSAIRPEQYDNFAAYLLCSFGTQAPTENAFRECPIDRIVDAGFWGFTALLFASIGFPVALVFMTRPEPFQWCWHMARHRRVIVTTSDWEQRIDGLQRSSSIEKTSGTSLEPVPGVPRSRERGPMGGPNDFQRVQKRRAKVHVATKASEPVSYGSEESDYSDSSAIPSSDSEDPARVGRSMSTTHVGMGGVLIVGSGESSGGFSSSGDDDDDDDDDENPSVITISD